MRSSLILNYDLTPIIALGNKLYYFGINIGLIIYTNNLREG